MTSGDYNNLLGVEGGIRASVQRIIWHHVAGKGLTSWLSFVVSSVSLSLSHWYPGSGVVLDCIDS